MRVKKMNETLNEAKLELAKRELQRRLSTQPAEPLTTYDRVMGSGEVDTLGEKVGDVIGSAGAGMLRGMRGIASTPELIGRAAVRSGQELMDLAGYDDNKPNVPIFESATGQLFDEGYAALANTFGADPKGIERKGETTPAEYLGTVGEFIPAVVTGAALKPLVVSALGSETAGQITEGTIFEPIARVLGAFAAPATANKTVKAFSKKADERPSLDNQRNYKNAAYAEVDASGVKFLPNEVGGLLARIKSSLDLNPNYVPEVDKQTAASLKVLESQLGKELTIGQLDKLRQGLYKRYSVARNEDGIKGMIDEIDDLIYSKEPANKLMNIAREANKRYKKSELLDNAIIKAQDQAGASGSGGNVVNKYRQAMTTIINSKRDSKYFSKDEIELMRKFVRGDVKDNALRLVGKLSPTGNGLMQALNIAAIASNPQMVLGTIAGATAKVKSEKSAMKSVDEILDMIATGLPPENKKLISKETIAILLGLQAN
tara:strand:+ start:893 stop:2356 length:1464 start_codon:yes stop_codon:yes gene_type:complete